MSAPAIAVPPPRRTIAPVWHTFLYLVALACFSGLGSRLAGMGRFGLPPRMASYAFIIATEWLLLVLAAWGLRLGGTSIGEVLGEHWPNSLAFFRDLGLAVVFVVTSNVVLAMLTQLLHATQNARVLRLLPATRGEMVVWMFVAVSAGICEEFATRGYLQQQLSGLLRSEIAGLFAQGVIFGIAHLYQGWKFALTIACLGCMLGALAQWRRSLLPGMLAHSIQDIMGGLLRGGH